MSESAPNDIREMIAVAGKREGKRYELYWSLLRNVGYTIRVVEESETGSNSPLMVAREIEPNDAFFSSTFTAYKLMKSVGRK